MMWETSSHPALFFDVGEFFPLTILFEASTPCLILAALLGFFVHRTPYALEIPKVVTLALFAAMGAIAIKFIPFAGLYAAAVISLIWRRGSVNSDTLGGLGEGIERFGRLIIRIPFPVTALILMTGIVSNLIAVYGEPLSETRLARRAMDYFITRGLPHPLLNAFSDGGYIMYRLADAEGTIETRVSIDGRTNLITEPLWEAHQNALYGEREWHDYITRFSPRTILWESDAPLSALLVQSGEWCEVYKDPRSSQLQVGYSLFVRKGPAGCV
jgi:hypothetical protein